MTLDKLSLLVLCILSFNLGATESFIARLAPKSVLLDLEFYAQGLIAVGERGHILISPDGESWTQETVPSLATLTAVAVHQNSVWAVGHDAVILYKGGEDKDWVVQQFLPNREKPLLDVIFFDDQKGIAIGAYGSYFHTSNGGASWQLQMHPEFLHPYDLEYLEEIRLEDEEFYQQELISILPHLNRISMHDNRLYIAGEAGLLAYSDDLGESWQRMQVDYEGSFFDIRNTSKGLIAAGLRGNVFKFDAINQTWGEVDVDTSSSFNSIVQLSEGVLLVGNNGRLMHLSEAGNKISQTEEGQPLASAIEFKNSIIAVGTNGIQNLDIAP